MKMLKKVSPLAVFFFSYSLSYAEGTYKKHMESGAYDQAGAHADSKFESHNKKAKRYIKTRETMRQYGEPGVESEATRQANKHIVKSQKWVDKENEAREAKENAPPPPPYEAHPTR